jgi:hypothetical protein
MKKITLAPRGTPKRPGDDVPRKPDTVEGWLALIYMELREQTRLLQKMLDNDSFV